MVVFQKDNQIHLIDSINNNIVKQFHIYFEKALDTNKPNIELHISSPGGDLNSAHKIIDILSTSYKPVDLYIHNTVNYGGYHGIASAATVIAAYCNKKIIDNNATFLIHHARNAYNNKIVYDEDNILFWMEQTGLDYNTINKYLTNEKIIYADDALINGFVNDISFKNYVIPL